MVKLKETDLYKRYLKDKKFRKELIKKIKNDGRGFEYVCRAIFEKEGYTTIDKHYKDVDSETKEGFYREQDINAFMRFPNVEHGSIKYVQFYPTARFIGECRELNEYIIIIREKSISDPNLGLNFPFVTEEFRVMDLFLKYGLLLGDISQKFKLENFSFNYELIKKDGKSLKLENPSLIYSECASVSTATNYSLSIFNSRVKDELKQFSHNNAPLYDAIENKAKGEDQQGWNKLVSYYRENFQLYIGVYFLIPIIITKAPIMTLNKNGKLKEVKYFLHPFTPKHLDKFTEIYGLTIPILICNHNYLKELVINMTSGIMKMCNDAKTTLPRHFDSIISEYKKYCESK